MRRIFITNDDGIASKGIEALTEVAAEFGKVVVVAPNGARSGASGSITAEHPIRLHKVKEIENVSYYWCNGTPVDCVKIGLYELFQDQLPDILLSGINHGSNSSVSIHYSGTMGAAIEGAIRGIRSVGFSLCDLSHNADFTQAKEVVRQILSAGFQNEEVLSLCSNINIPVGEVKGLKYCRQSSAYWTQEFDKRERNQQPYYWMSGFLHNREPEAIETDEWALNNGYASVVPVSIDMTDYKSLEELLNRSSKSEQI